MVRNARDRAILQFLREYQLALPPGPIYRNMKLQNRAQFTYETLRRRLNYLEEADYVERLFGAKSYYRITDKGERYLTDELDVDDIDV